MAKDQLKSFKASDVQQKPLPRSGKGKQSEAAAVSAGFPTIESVVEKEQLDLSGLQQRLELLHELADEGTAKQKGAAAKAIAAYERTADLLEHLWDTKLGMIEGQKK